MMKTWLIRRAVRKPVVLEVTARVNSSVCRLPFIRSSPLDSRMSSTPFIAAASLWGTSTTSKSSIRRPCSRATAEIFAAGPTRIGTLTPASAASIGPRSEVSSQGCTTIVRAAETFFARASSRSYLVGGGAANAPIAEMAPISLFLSACMRLLPSSGLPGRFCLAFGSNRANGGGTRDPTVIDTEEAGDLAQPRALLGRKRAARSQYLSDQIERLHTRFGIGWKHRRDRGERHLLVDQEHVVLLAHEHLEGRQGKVGVSLAN